MKKLLLLIALFALTFSLAACKKDDADPECTAPEVLVDGKCELVSTTFVESERVYDTSGTLAADQTLEWNIGADPATLDPGLNGASDGGDVINQTFEGLVREINGEIYLGIAEEIVTSPDGLTVTFNLRESKWSDGSDLTASDFVYSWLRAMDPDTASEYSWIWEYTNVVGAQAYAECDSTEDDCDALRDAVGISADGLVLTVELMFPTDYFVSLMAFYHFNPVKQSAVEATGGEDGLWAKDKDLVVSNGPFVLTDYRINYRLTLSKNDYYWNASNVVLSKIDGYFIDEESTAFTAFNNGEFHFIPSVPTANVPALIATSDEFYVFPLLGTYYYSFNMDADGDGVNEGYDQDGLWSNMKLRTALSYSIDRKAITDTLAAGQVPAGGFVPPGFLDHEGYDFFETAGTYGLEIDDTNYAEAKLLFAEAAAELNMTEAELKTALEAEELYHNTSEGHALVAAMVQQMWFSNLGFTMPLNNAEWAVFQVDRSEGNFSIARGGWLTDYMDPSGLLGIFASTNSYNDPNFYNDDFDALLAAAQATTDKKVHFEKLYDAQELFMGQMPIIPVYHYTDTMLVSDHLVDWGRSVLGTVDFSGARIVE